MRDLYTTPKRRANLFSCYVDNIADYLAVYYPEAPQKELRQFVESYVREHVQHLADNLAKAQDQEDFDPDLLRDPEERLLPTVDIIRPAYVHPADGSAPVHTWQEHLCMPLFQVTDMFSDKLISPFGTFYETTDKTSSFLKGLIDVKLKQRKTEKKAMLAAKKEGDKVAATFHNNNQATIKILMNSLIGAMGSGFNFMSSTANFNSVTSIARYFIMNAYAHAERFLESNFYFRSEEQVINHLVTCKLRGPAAKTVESYLRSMGWYLPTVKDVYAFLTRNLHRYMFPCEHPAIYEYLDTLDVGHLGFVYYMSNLRNLFMKNDWYFRTWCQQFFDLDGVDYSLECTAEDLLKLDGDLAVVLSTVCHKWLPVNNKGNSLSLFDVTQVDVGLARRLYCVGRHMQSKIDEIQEGLDLFMDHRVGIANVQEHKQMFRDCIILSDTDSIIFTTKTWAEWYTGRLTMNDSLFNINALVVYLLTKANSHILFHVSEVFGALGQDLLRMAMKNEFMMPIEILTSLKKHYASILAIQEGVFYGTPKLDIKGVNLRGSNFSRPTLTYVTWFIQSIIDEIYRTGKILLKDRIADVLRFERLIYDDVREGYTRYLQVAPIREDGEYADADKTIYFNYRFWEKVFAEKYGAIAIPTKCFVLPLTNVRSGQYFGHLQDKFPDIAPKLEAFFEEYPDKPISRIPINPLTDRIPEELRFVTHYKAIVYANARPMYLILQSFGITPGNSKKQSILFSDVYGWVTKEEGQKALEHTLTDD